MLNKRKCKHVIDKAIDKAKEKPLQKDVTKGVQVNGSMLIDTATSEALTVQLPMSVLLLVKQLGLGASGSVSYLNGPAKVLSVFAVMMLMLSLSFCLKQMLI